MSRSNFLLGAVALTATAFAQPGETTIPARTVVQVRTSQMLVVTHVSKQNLAVDLPAITIAGQRYRVASDSATVTGTDKSGLGANKRTSKFVGGGALGGTVIGAIAGGGKGAALGAFAGAAGGATAPVLTEGESARVPAESLLTFRLAHPFRR